MLAAMNLFNKIKLLFGNMELRGGDNLITMPSQAKGDLLLSLGCASLL